MISNAYNQMGIKYQMVWKWKNKISKFVVDYIFIDQLQCFTGTYDTYNTYDQRVTSQYITIHLE